MFGTEGERERESEREREKERERERDLIMRKIKLQPPQIKIIIIACRLFV